MFDTEYLDALVDEVYAEMEAAWRKQVEGVSKEQIPQLLAQKAECQTKVDHLIDFIENGGSAKLNVKLEARYSELERIEAKLKAARGAVKLERTRDDVHALVYQSVENLVGVLKEDVALARMVLHKHIKKLLLFGDDTKRQAFVIGEIDLFPDPSDGTNGVLLECEGTVTHQQHTNHYYRFAMHVDPDLQECPLLEPLCMLLAAQPELGHEPKSSGAWAKLLRNSLGEAWDDDKPLGYGAVARCFRVHKLILEERLKIEKTKNPYNNGHLYRLSLLPSDAVDEQPRYDLAEPVDMRTAMEVAHVQIAASHSASTD
jgi:ribosome-associated translation inhibitor RaiA